MTTAHRPTWYNAIGGENQGGNRKVSQTAKVCSKDLPGHLKMKTRDLSDYIDDKQVMKDNLMKLENNKDKKILAIENIKNITTQKYTNPFPEDEDDIVEEDFIKALKKRKRRKERIGRNTHKSEEESEEENENEEDEDSSGSDGENDNERDSDEEEEEEEEEDEEEKELMRELENLKREKMEKEKKEKEEQEQLKRKKNNVLTNNPLINLMDDNNDDLEEKEKKRKWTDDTIFRNTCQTKKEQKRTFVNDSVRSTFHKKFLFRYIH